MPLDIVKVLKIENPAEGGTQTDWGPTEIDSGEDYITAKGYIFEDNQAIVVDQSTGNLRFQDQFNAPVTLTDITNAINNAYFLAVAL